MKVFSLLSLYGNLENFIEAGISNHSSPCLVHHAVPALSPYGCGVLFICFKVLQNLRTDKRIAPHFFFIESLLELSVYKDDMMSTYEDDVKTVINDMLDNGCLKYGPNGNVMIPDEISARLVFDGLITRVGVYINDNLDQKIRMHRVRGYNLTPKDMEDIISGYCEQIVRWCVKLIIDVRKTEVIKVLKETVNPDYRRIIQNEE